MTGILLAAALAFQDKDPFENFALGQRVKVVLKTDRELTGALCEPRGVKDYDLKRSPTVALDLRPEIEATVGFEKKLVKSVSLIEAAAPKPRPPEPQERSRPKAESQEQSRPKTEPPAPPPPPEPEEPKKEKSDDDKAREIYAEFPEKDGWGPDKFEELKKFLVATGRDDPKYLDLRLPVKLHENLKTWAPARYDEAKFLDNYELWKRGKELKSREDKPPE